MMRARKYELDSSLLVAGRFCTAQEQIPAETSIESRQPGLTLRAETWDAGSNRTTQEHPIRVSAAYLPVPRSNVREVRFQNSTLESSRHSWRTVLGSQRLCYF